MPENYRVTPEGIKIKEDKIPAACHEIQELVEKVIQLHGLSYGVRVFGYTIQIQDWIGYRISIEILDYVAQRFGSLEYDSTYTFPYHPDVFLFKWHSSSTTNIPGDSITLEDRIKRVLAHTFKPINRQKRRSPIKKKKKEEVNS